MPKFPESPIEPREFLGEFLPALFAEFEVPEAFAPLDESVGLLLRGESGGTWRIGVRGGEIRVEADNPEGSAITLVQSVDDWRGALWEGRGGPFGEYAAKLFTPRAAALLEEVGARVPVRPEADIFGPLREVEGLVAVVVTDATSGDWCIAVKLGPGPVPDEPCTTISISAGDAAALGSGELKALEAFLAGRIQIEGDVGLVMQLQGALMQVKTELGGD